MEHRTGYTTLAEALTAAYDRASIGKGAERHANQRPFEEQPIFKIAEKRGVGFLLGQVDKKLDEGPRLPTKAAFANEVLDSIVYLAALYIMLTRAPNRGEANCDTDTATKKLCFGEG